jgi:hypothetical protein
MKKVTILSIDGRGIRGILPGVILAYIEKNFRKKPKIRMPVYAIISICWQALTSTGGILTCMYVTPGNKERPKFTAQDVVDLYLTERKFFQSHLDAKSSIGLDYCSPDIRSKTLKKYCIIIWGCQT